MTPTFLEYAGVQHPGETYQGRSIHPLMGKSIKPLLEGAVQQVHSDDEVFSQELFGYIAAYMGEWKALKQTFPNGTGEWRLFNLAQDVTEDIRSDLSQQYPDVLNKMVSSYESYAREVGIIPPQFDPESQESYEEPFGNETLHIEYGARLTYRQTRFYTTALVELGFLLRKKNTGSDPYQCFEITDKGRYYLQLFGELEDDLRPSAGSISVLKFVK